MKLYKLSRTQTFEMFGTSRCAKMRVFVVFASIIATCIGSAIPRLPRDSQYVEGKTRFIWLSDGEGVPTLVDLNTPVDEEALASRTGANNQYWLYTRNNPTTAQIITHGNVDSILHSNYVASKPLMVIAHGWTNNGNHQVNTMLTEAFLAAQDVNVIVVDYRTVAALNYVSAVFRVPDVGQHLAEFLSWLIETGGGTWDNVHLVGYSLGAHVVGNAGRAAGGLPARVTGLDPAGPLWQTNRNRLSIGDGQYVEAIHTDGLYQGIYRPIGDADFYPNGGVNPMPGCVDSGCSHARAYQYFASSIYSNHFVGKSCQNIIEAGANRCQGSLLNMGNNILNKRGSGLYGLSTGESWPF
ncbi:pancreatic triacylglycerol lipase [Amyelois transitella]|uniref:pancreatic triacylglycerol lipase n=1 Tax=Amyelois transitella TaxID=680683 RepID=UPI00298FBBCF|nr:pancreatic triacylglycerol lipase [Amyelois transitella]